VLLAPYFWLFVCVFVAVSSFVLFLDGKMVDFGDNCYFINRFKPAVNDVDDVSSSWKRGVSLETK
jgi:hypothetical protein